MFRKRDEEENAIDAANAEGAAPESAKNNTTKFGNFMDNEVGKKEETTSKSLFGINNARGAAKEEAEAKAEAEPKKTSALFSKPAADAAPKASTYKLSSSGAVTAAAPAASPSRGQISNGISGSQAGNIDKIETEKRLTVGYGIELEGKISNCDKLIVYGHVHADLTDVKTLHISESGKFSGFAAIENAEISGAFEGDLIVEDSIVINSTGKMSGKVTYGSIEIKPGGKFTGQIVDASDLSAADMPKKAKRSEKKAERDNQEEFTLSPDPVASKEEAVA